MERLVALPLFGYLSVFGLFALGGTFDGLGPGATLGAFALGLVCVFAVVAGFAFGRGYRGGE